jgi:hypothetical protein
MNRSPPSASSRFHSPTPQNSSPDSLNSSLDLHLKTAENRVWCLRGIPNDKRRSFFRVCQGEFGENANEEVASGHGLARFTKVHDGEKRGRTKRLDNGGNSSVVEHRLGEARVAGSNPVSRSISSQYVDCPVYLHSKFGLQNPFSIGLAPLDKT